MYVCGYHLRCWYIDRLENGGIKEIDGYCHYCMGQNDKACNYSVESSQHLQGFLVIQLRSVGESFCYHQKY